MATIEEAGQMVFGYPGGTVPSVDGVRVTRAVLEAIVADARASYPDEIAGVLGATESAVISRALELCRGSSDAVRVPRRLLAEARGRFAEEGLVYAGTYHSHGRARAYPSEVDRMSLATGELMIIVSVRMREVRAFRCPADGRRLEELFIIGQECR